MNTCMRTMAWMMLVSAVCRAADEGDTLNAVMIGLRGMVEHATGTAARSTGPDLMAELAEQAPELIAKGGLRDAAATPRWRAWQEKLLTLDTAGRRAACGTASALYASLRRAFQDAQLSNNVRALCILSFEAEFTCRQIESLKDNNQALTDRRPVAPVRDLRAAYDKAVRAVRMDWMTALQPDRAQAAAINQIIGADSLIPLAALIEVARTNDQSTVSLAWLAMTCQALALQDPLGFAYWYGAATCVRLTGDMRAENEVWRQTLALFPDDPYVHFRLAYTCGTSEHQATRALAHLRWLVARVQGGVWALRIQNELARRCVQLGAYSDAAPWIADTVNRASRKLTSTTIPLYIEARMIESDALLRQGRPDDALSALEKAATAAPDNPTIALAAAHMLFGLATGGTTVDTDRVEAALLWYDKVLRTQPRCAAVHARKAYLNMLLGKWDRAQAEAVTELTIEPRSVCALTVLGMCYLGAGDAANALVFFNKALDLDPGCAAAHDGRDLAKASLSGAGSAARQGIEN